MVTKPRNTACLFALAFIPGWAWASALLAQSPAGAPPKAAPPAPLSAEAVADRIAPLVDDQVFLVLHADLAGIDVEAALQSVFADLTATAPKDLVEHIQKIIPQAQPVATRWLADVLRCGGRDAYLLFSMERIPQDWGMLAVPLGPKADANALAGLFLTGRPEAVTSSRPARRPAHGFLGDQTTAVAGGLLLIGPGDLVEETKQRLSPAGRPATRPSPDIGKTLRAAFASCADMRVQALLLLSKDARRVIEETMPEFPPQIGGGPTTALTRGLLWAAVGANPPPDLSLKLRVQSADAESAAAFAAFWGRVLKTVAEHAKDELPIDLTPLVAALAPKVQGSQVTLDLSPKEAKSLFLDVGIPVLLEGIAAGRRSVTGPTISTLGTAIIVYASANKGKFPPDLETLVQSKNITPGLLINPRRPGKSPGFVYIKPPENMSQADPTRLILYEAQVEWPDGVWVCFADGHCEILSGPQGQKRFEKLLAAARPAAPATSSAPAK